MAETTDQLMNDARCIDKCVPDGMKLAVLISIFQQLLVNGTGSGGGSGTLFTSAQQPLNVITWTFAHGLGATPSFQAGVLVALNTDVGFVAGNEVPLSSWFCANQSVPLFSIEADPVNIVVTAALIPAGNEAQIGVVQKTGGGGSHMTNAAFWAMKVYARL